MVHRHESVAAILLLLVVSAVAAAQPQASDPEARPAGERPNIIHIMADDLGYGDLGCFGQERIRTPRIDQLAAEGMKFTSYYSGSTVCRASRLVLRMGLHSGNTPISGNESYVLKPDDRITTKLMEQAGYAVGGVGKWALGGPDTPGAPHRQGLDFWFGYLDQTAAHNYWPEFLWLNDVRVPLANEVDYADRGYAKGRSGVATHKEDYSHDWMTAAALRWIRQHKDEPFFFQAHYTIPHANNQAGQHGMEVPGYGPYAEKDWPTQEKGFAAMITRLDGDVGRIIDLLRELGIAQNTLVIFTSDNGPHSEGGHDPDFFNSNGPLRGIKRDLYEGGIRVPTIAWWPGRIEAGSTTDRPFAFWDFMPTACELAGVEPPAGIDGVSYLPTLLGRTDQQKPHDPLYWEFRGKQAVRKGKWKAVRPGSDKPVELYDLEQDIGEQNDVADQHSDVMAEMERIMGEYR